MFYGGTALLQRVCILNYDLGSELNLSPAFPHLSVSDDEYMGYHVPAGSLVYGNVWYVVPQPC